ncbi:MAG: hypothetical protein R6W96_04300 [Clostridia bacterium]
MNLFKVTHAEKAYLRELAKRQLEYARLPVMAEREKSWFRHNDGTGERPMVVMEINPFRGELYPPMHCTSPFARAMEDQLLFHLVNHESVDDDKVVPDCFTVEPAIHILEHGFERVSHHATDARGRQIGYAMVHPVKDLRQDFHLIGPSVYRYDEKQSLEKMDAVNDVLGDILPVAFHNNSLQWYMSFTARAVNLMGLETLMVSMMDYPEETHALFQLIIEDSLGYMRWQEETGLLTLNNHNDKAGAGSYGFTKQLPTEECRRTGRIGLRDLWGNMNSQESVGISPTMYREFIYPYFEKAAKEFGLVYYGCCEPVHAIWKDCLENLPNLKKVSISAWCDEKYMGEALAGTEVVYSRKPSPNYIGVGNFDEQAFREHIGKTVAAARNCRLEIIFRDIYTLDDDPGKVKKAVRIVREMTEGGL